MKSPTSQRLVRALGIALFLSAFGSLLAATNAGLDDTITNPTVPNANNGSYNPTTNQTTFSWTVTDPNRSGYGISHWVLGACDISSYIVSASEGTDREWATPDGSTGTYGLKFTGGYNGGASRVVTLVLSGYWPTGPVVSVVKEGNQYNYFTALGPVSTGNCTPGTPPVDIPPPVPPLVVNCPANVVRCADVGQNYATYTVPGLAVGTNISGGTPSYSVTVSAGSLVPASSSNATYQFPLGTTTVTYTVTDSGAGDAQQSKQCSLTVTVTRCVTPGGDPTNNNASLTGSCGKFDFCALTSAAGLTSATFTGTGADAGITAVCSPAGNVNGVLALAPGQHTFNYTATDGNGNSQGVLTITMVADTTAPTASITTSGQTIHAGASCSATLAVAGSASDNCDTVNPAFQYKAAADADSAYSTFVSGVTPLGLGTWNIRAKAVDASGNVGVSSPITVVVDDITPPSIAAISPITVNNDAGQCGAVVTFTVNATDCSGPVNVVSVPASGSVFPVGTTTVSVTATDVANNSSTTSFTVTVIDAEKPVIAPQANITVTTEAGKCDALVTFNVSGTDNCSGVSVVASPASGSRFSKGSTPVTITATDVAGNVSTSTFNVIVNDEEKPTIEAHENISVNTETGKCDALVNFTIAGADNCPGVIVTASPASGSRFAKGTTTVTITATDSSGNTTTSTFTVTVADNEKPIITPQADITLSTELGVCDAAVTFTVNATDNCPGVTFSSSIASGSRFAKGTTAVTITATDAAGNTSTHSFNVTVNDTEKPKILGLSDLTLYTGANATVCSATATYLATATDNCGGTVGLLYSIPSGSSFPVGSTVVTVTAQDAAGNTVSQSFTVTVVDNTAPAITLVAPTISYTQGTCGALVAFNDTAKDNCKGAVAVTYDLAPGSYGPGTYTVTATATDGTNSASTTFTFTVNNNTGLVQGNVFYDLNINGTLESESALAGWTVTVSGPASGSAVTAANGSYSINGLVPGTYTVNVTVSSGWVVTTTSRSVSVGGSNSCTATLNVGCVKYGARGGLSKGFWTSKNGQSVFGGNSVNNLAVLFGANLKNANGTDFDPTSYNQVSSFLNGASATNMANMLSAQLTAVLLDIQPGNQAPGAKFGLNCTGNDLLYVGNIAGGTNLYPSGFVTINTVITDANAALAATGGNNTTTVSALRTTQETLKSILDGVCNNTNFVLAP